ncbi:VWA-like domain-containing protein [Caballeronia sp. TF1N1]|uniref:vWA domain-containing protein n=1 Tax=Caballeronia sp. TF1N1 TaxID=2878153 RepID=UPI001FD4E6B4|nr:VWA-like domain-containing protein [Caballeronia sp. TF1N1]
MQAADPASMDLRVLNKLLDVCKSSVFLSRDMAAFLGSIMSNLDFIWSRELPTAAVDGIHFWWNPEFFMSLDPDSRNTVLRHELWHVARLHMVRQGGRDPGDWNKACDHVINNDLKKEGAYMGGFPYLMDPQYDNMAEEDIYDHLQSLPTVPFNAFGPGSGLDMFPISQADKNKIVQTVVTAIQQAKMSGAGHVPGDITEMVEQFLKPVIPWQTVLQRWFSEMLEEDYTWAKPNRRFDDVYLPGRKLEMGRLENLRWYIDVSGSITMSHATRFKSELKFVKDTFRPEKLTVVQFDTKIQRKDTWEEDDEFERLEITGRGGTSLDCVHRDMLEEKPTAAIIFSDMECSPMDARGVEDIPVLWVRLGRRGHTPSFGDVVEIDENPCATSRNSALPQRPFFGSCFS